jgi:hypothetical protein
LEIRLYSGGKRARAFRAFAAFFKHLYSKSYKKRAGLTPAKTGSTFCNNN